MLCAARDGTAPGDDGGHRDGFTEVASADLAWSEHLVR